MVRHSLHFRFVSFSVEVLFQSAARFRRFEKRGRAVPSAVAEAPPSVELYTQEPVPMTTIIINEKFVFNSWDSAKRLSTNGAQEFVFILNI